MASARPKKAVVAADPAANAVVAAKNAQFWFLVLLTATASLLLVFVLAPMAGALFASIVFAIILEPVQEWLVKLCRGRRTVAATVLTTLLVALVVLPLGGLGIALAGQAETGLERLQATVAEQGVEPMLESVPRPLRSTARELLQMVAPGGKKSPPAETPAAEVPPKSEQPRDASGREKTPETGSLSAAGSLTSAKNFVFGLIGGLGRLSFDLVVFVVGLLFLLASGRQLMDWLLEIMPLPAGDGEDMLHELGETTRGVFLAMVVTAMAQTIIATVGYLLAGTPFLMLVAAGTFVVALIPVLGGAFAGFVVGLITLLAGHTGAGLFLMAWSAVVINLVDNLLRPMLAEGRVRLPGSVIFFAMLGGIAVFGAMGMVGGPLAVVFFRSTIRLLGQKVATPQEG